MFFTTQTHQERTYQEYVASKTKEKNTQLEQYCQQVMTKTEAEIKCILCLENLPLFSSLGQAETKCLRESPFTTFFSPYNLPILLKTY